jgi:hypothetical protein
MQDFQPRISILLSRLSLPQGTQQKKDTYLISGQDFMPCC